MGVSLVGPAGGREKLTANRTYYVRTDGNDSNNGLSNSSGGAFATPGAALAAAAKIDFNGFTVAVKLGDGTYSGTIIIPRMVGQATVGSLVMDGNSSTPANVILSQTGSYGTCIEGPPGASVTVRNLKLTSTNGYGMRSTGAEIEYSNIVFGTCAQSHVTVEGGFVVQIGNCTIDGNALSHWWAGGSGVIKSQSRTITASGTRNSSYAFAIAGYGGVIISNGNAFPGTFTGTRYSVDTGGVIQTFGSGANYFPGNSADNVTAPGAYV